MQKYCALVHPNCIILFSAVKVSGDIAKLLHYLRISIPETLPILLLFAAEVVSWISQLLQQLSSSVGRCCTTARPNKM